MLCSAFVKSKIWLKAFSFRALNVSWQQSSARMSLHRCRARVYLKQNWSETHDHLVQGTSFDSLTLARQQVYCYDMCQSRMRISPQVQVDNDFSRVQGVWRSDFVEMSNTGRLVSITSYTTIQTQMMPDLKQRALGIEKRHENTSIFSLRPWKTGKNGKGFCRSGFGPAGTKFVHIQRLNRFTAWRADLSKSGSSELETW